MLEILRGKVKNLDNKNQKKIRLIKSDMSNFNLNEKYDLIIFPGIAFQALTTKFQRDSCLECVKQHLSDDGKVIIVFLNLIWIKFSNCIYGKRYKVK
jgi:histone deacetylase complex regulatory component SIN3